MPTKEAGRKCTIKRVASSAPFAAMMFVDRTSWDLDEPTARRSPARSPVVAEIPVVVAPSDAILANDANATENQNPPFLYKNYRFFF